MQQLSWKIFPVKIEKSLCKLFGLKYAPNLVHNSVTIYSVKALSVFLCVKELRRPGGAEAYAAACPSHGGGVFLSRAGDYQIAPKPPGGRLWVVRPRALGYICE